MSVQTNSQTTNTPQADVQPNSNDGLEDSLNPIFKAIADLQEAVKDLATAVTAGAEVQEGLEETLATKSAELETLKKEFAEVQKFAVGFQHAAAENKASDKFGKLAGTPAKSESAQDTVEAADGALREAGAPMLNKEVKKGITSVETPRPSVEVGNKLQSNQGEDLVKEILDGKVKPMEAAKRAYEMQYGGN